MELIYLTFGRIFVWKFSKYSTVAGMHNHLSVDVSAYVKNVRKFDRHCPLKRIHRSNKVNNVTNLHVFMPWCS